MNPSSEQKLALLVAGISTPLLVIALVVLAIVTYHSYHLDKKAKSYQ